MKLLGLKMVSGEGGSEVVGMVYVGGGGGGGCGKGTVSGSAGFSDIVDR